MKNIITVLICCILAMQCEAGDRDKKRKECDRGLQAEVQRLTALCNEQAEEIVRIAIEGAKEREKILKELAEVKAKWREERALVLYYKLKEIKEYRDETIPKLEDLGKQEQEMTDELNKLRMEYNAEKDDSTSDDSDNLAND
jgi:hypothetical protein